MAAYALRSAVLGNLNQQVLVADVLDLPHRQEGNIRARKGPGDLFGIRQPVPHVLAQQVVAADDIDPLLFQEGQSAAFFFLFAKGDQQIHQVALFDYARQRLQEKGAVRRGQGDIKAEIAHPVQRGPVGFRRFAVVLQLFLLPADPFPYGGLADGLAQIPVQRQRRNGAVGNEVFHARLQHVVLVFLQEQRQQFILIANLCDGLGAGLVILAVQLHIQEHALNPLVRRSIYFTTGRW